MGNSRSTLTDLNLFSKRRCLHVPTDCTFFTKKDILRLYKRFYALNPSKVGTNMQDSRTSIIKLTFEEVEKMPELKENPFRRRICDVFSEDGYGNLTFDDFLDMFSVFSETAPLHLKLKYAFKIYDYDNDDQLGHDDLSKTIRCLTRDELSDEEVEFIIEREFEHAISRSTDFQRVFHIRI
ncbi:Calcium and integrin-binding family member 2 [Aphelenchoides besseyi]|nr:Calcium and integrin-binding family member 2 [Aphelenchoides besseyi]